VQGNVASARDQLAALAEEYPQDEAPVRALYRLELQQGDAAAASAALGAGLERMPGSLVLNWMRAGELEREGDFEGAIAVYERLYEANRDNLVIANNLASLITTHRDDPESLERAHAVAQRLRGLEVPEFQDTYGWIAYRRGQYDEALRHLEPAAAALSEHALVQYHLGMTYAALERTEEARARLERALELAGDSPLPQYESARRALAELPEPEAEPAPMDGG
jgi:cellulose synthase operon protein C